MSFSCKISSSNPISTDIYTGQPRQSHTPAVNFSALRRSPLPHLSIHGSINLQLPAKDQRLVSRQRWPADQSTNYSSPSSQVLHSRVLAGGSRQLCGRGFSIRASASPGGSEPSEKSVQTSAADPSSSPALLSNDLLQLFNDAQQNMLFLNQERLRAVEELAKSMSDNRFLLAQVDQLQSEAERARAEVKVKDVQLQAQQMEGELATTALAAASPSSRPSVPSPLWTHFWLTIDALLVSHLLTVEEAAGVRQLVREEDKGVAAAFLEWQRGGGQRKDEVAGRLVGLLHKERSRGLHIIHVCAELAPVAHKGSLGSWLLGLCKSLRSKGQTVEVVMPLYASCATQAVENLTELDTDLMSFFGGEWHRNRVWTGSVEGIPVTFLDPHHPAGFFSRDNMYGYQDDFQRFAYFSRCALEWVVQLGKKADVLHLHDWHTSLVAPLFWELYAHRGLSSTRILLTCHDFQSQMAVPPALLGLCGLDPLQLARPDRLQDNSDRSLVNVLKGGIVYSNAVTTVSPEYSTAVTLSRQRGAGHGLETTVIDHENKFSGLPSGLSSPDPHWDPTTDPFLPLPFSSSSVVEGKAAAREALRIRGGAEDRVIVGCVLPSASPSDVDRVVKAMEGAGQAGAQFVFLGTAEAVGQVAAREGGLSSSHRASPPPLLLEYEPRLAHCAVAAADLLLCCSGGDKTGEMAMIGARYGALPIVRQMPSQQYTSIVDIDDPERSTAEGNGFVFHRDADLPKTLQRAIQRKSIDPSGWERHRLIGMEADYSWDAHGADAYVDAYWALKRL